MNNEKFTITVSSGMQIASIEQIDNTVVVLVEGARTEPKNHIPKEGDFVRYTNMYGTGYFVCGGQSFTSVKQKQNTYYIFSGDEIRVHDASSSNIDFPFYTNEFETISKDEFCKSINNLGYEYNFDTNEIELLKWQPKEGDEVHNVLFGVNSNRFYIHSFIWSMSRELTDCMKQSKEKAQQLCDKLNAALNEK